MGNKKKNSYSGRFPPHSSKLKSVALSSQSKSNINHKTSSIFLLIIGVGMLFFWFKMPVNETYFNNAVIEKYKFISENFDSTSIEYRKKNRFGNRYIISQAIKNFLQNDKAENDVILLPSDSYLAKNNIEEKLLPSPNIIYCWTGVKSAYANSTFSKNAKWVVVIKNKELAIQKIVDSTQFQDFIRLYSSD